MQMTLGHFPEAHCSSHVPYCESLSKQQIIGCEIYSWQITGYHLKCQYSDNERAEDGGCKESQCANRPLQRVATLFVVVSNIYR